MQRFGSRERGVSLLVRDILIIIICLLVILNVVQFAVTRTSAIRDAELRNTLVELVRADIESARSVAAQLSRTGGTSSQRSLAETRQYLYGITQLNAMTSALYRGGQVAPQATVDKAMEAVDACEARRQEGLAMDTPLSELWQLLSEISEAVAKL